jgi:hypothetical protein
MRHGYGTRIFVTTTAAMLALTGLGCGAIRNIAGGGGSSASGSPASSPTTEGPPEYNPDAMGEVVGTNCRYDQKAQQFRYDVSVQNASADHAFKYSISIAFAGGSDAFSDDSFGTQYNDVTVGPGKDRTLVITQGYQMTKRTYYGCTIRSATKSLAA